MKRLVMDGTVLQLRRTKDQCYCYTLNPSGIHHKSNKTDHAMKLVDVFIELEMPEKCLIEPTLGSYEPDMFYKDHFNRSVCVEVQLTKISLTKMQKKIDQFVKEYGKEHDAKLIMLYSDYAYSKLSIPSGFKLIVKPIPKEKDPSI